jgi:hypothetical protein
MIPMKLTIEKPRGTEISCGRIAAAGVFAREAKSGALLSGCKSDPHQVWRKESARYKCGHVRDT